MNRPDDIPKTAPEQIELLPSVLSLWNLGGRNTPPPLADLILFGEPDTLAEIRARIPHDDLADWGLSAVDDDEFPLPGDLDRILSDPEREIEAERYRLICTIFHSEAGHDWIAAKAAGRRVFTRLSNKAMQRKLNAGLCIDVSGCPFDKATGYALPGFVEGVDYADAKREAWIWSIASEDATGDIYASTGTDYYQRDGFTCLFLR